MKVISIVFIKLEEETSGLVFTTMINLIKWLWSKVEIKVRPLSCLLAVSVYIGIIEVIDISLSLSLFMHGSVIIAYPAICGFVMYWDTLPLFVEIEVYNPYICSLVSLSICPFIHHLLKNIIFCYKYN